MKYQAVEGVRHFSSGTHGPVVALVGGTHGNELLGVRIVEWLVTALTTNDLTLVSGELILAIGNPRAVARGERGSEPGADLNRCFSAEVLKQGIDSSYEHERARELSVALQEAEISIDLHATNKPSVPFVVTQPLPSLQAVNLYRWFGVTHIVTDPDLVFAGHVVTLDEYLGRQGRISLCYETGHATDLSRFEQIKTEILNLLGDIGVIDWKPGSVPIGDQQLYALTNAILYDVGFEFELGQGAYNFQLVQAGQRIGTFGSGCPCVASEDGVIIFPKIPSLWQPGQPVGYLARRVH